MSARSTSGAAQTGRNQNFLKHLAIFSIDLSADIRYNGGMTDTISRQALVIAANQMGAVLLEDNGQWTNRVEIRSSSSSMLYIVAQHKTNHTWGCSCPGWKRHRHCKHLATMLPLLLKAPAPTRPVRSR